MARPLKNKANVGVVEASMSPASQQGHVGEGVAKKKANKAAECGLLTSPELSPPPAASADSFLKALLSKIPQSVLKPLIEAAPPEIAQKVGALAAVEARPLESYFIFPKTLLARLHSSWFQEVVSFCPESFQGAALKAMQEEMGLEKKTFSDSVRRFLLQEALFRWPHKTMTEEEQLDLPLLGECSSEQLHSLAELVALYDLQEGVRKVVEKKRLQSIFERLSSLQQKYLKEILQGKTFHICDPIGLEAFLQMNPREAATFLHARGLQNIGMVLQREKPATCWFVLHRMDRESASIVDEGRTMENVPCDLKQLQKKFVHAFQFVQR